MSSNKFESGFSKSHVSLEEMIAALYSDVGMLRRMLKNYSADARFRFKLEVYEI